MLIHRKPSLRIYLWLAKTPSHGKESQAPTDTLPCGRVFPGWCLRSALYRYSEMEVYRKFSVE